MNPKEKAKDLLQNYWLLNSVYNSDLWIDMSLAKQCILITVNEIIEVCSKDISNCSDMTYFYWQEVKSEIEKL